MKYTFLPLLAILISAAPEQEGKKDYKALANRISVKVEPAVKSNAEWKDIVDWVNVKDNWEEVLKALDEKLGIYRNMAIKVQVLSKPSPSPAAGGGGPGGGQLYISTPAVITWAKKDSLDTKEFMKMVVTHEITHCYQVNQKGTPIPPTYNWPQWLYEGMGDYAANYTPRLKELEGKEVRDINSVSGTAKAPSPSLEPYARGLLFFKYLEATYGAEKTRDFLKAILIKEQPFKNAAKQISGKDWDKLTSEERTWSEEYLKKNSGK